MKNLLMPIAFSDYTQGAEMRGDSGIEKMGRDNFNDLNVQKQLSLIIMPIFYTFVQELKG